MQTSKRSKAAAPPRVSITLPVTTGGVKSQGARRRRKAKAQTSSVPVALGPHPTTGRPQIMSLSSTDGRIRVRHREYIQDVTGSVAFGCTSIPINPGLMDSFPWLSGLARAYESYVFHTLRYEYMPMVGTATAGAVVLAIDYDALDPTPPEKAQLLQMHGASRGSPWDYTVVSAGKQDLTKLPQRYTRKTVWSGNGDLKTYDVGNLLVGTIGMAAPSTVGELYVSYDVELRTPQPIIYAPEDFSVQINGGGTITTGQPLGTNAAFDANEVASYANDSGTVSFKRTGKFLATLISKVTNAASGQYAWNALNATVTDRGTAYNGPGYLQQMVELAVNSLPASVTPAIVTATAPSDTVLRVAPFRPRV